MLSEAQQLMPCSGCGALVPNLRGRAHPFIGASMGCWSVYGEVLLMQYGRSPALPLHRLTADAYAAQHPGVRSEQAAHSLGVHLIGLCVTLTQPYNFLGCITLLEKALNSRDVFTWLEPPDISYSLTILDIRLAAGTSDHESVVRCWAEQVWQAWQAHHDTIRRWVSLFEQ